MKQAKFVKIIKGNARFHIDFNFYSKYYLPKMISEILFKFRKWNASFHVKVHLRFLSANISFVKICIETSSGQFYSK